MAVKLKNIKNSSDSSDSSDANTTYTPPYKFGDYFLLILKILAGVLVFCWTTTTNYLNGLNINVDETYPLVTTNVSKNPYATRYDPGPIDMSNAENVSMKIRIQSWGESTQQSCYEAFGRFFLHHVFDSFKRYGGSSATDDDNDPVVKLFSFIKWFFFGVCSNIVMVCLFGVVFFMWIPGWIGGLTAFLPTTYYTSSVALKACKIALVLILFFIIMCIFGFVTVFPVIYMFFDLIYITFFKQIFENPAQFGNEFMKRMKQLIFLYVSVAIVVAFASNELPDATKITVALISVGILALTVVFAFYKNKQT
jgi:hypothetical protein